MAWADTRKHITFTCPNGHRCRDSSLHDETFLKENLVALFIYRQATGFCPRTLEPDEGWMIEAVNGLVRLGRSLKNSADLPPLPSPPTWTDSKQRRLRGILWRRSCRGKIQQKARQEDAQLGHAQAGYIFSQQDGENTGNNAV